LTPSTKTAERGYRNQETHKCAICVHGEQWNKGGRSEGVGNSPFANVFILLNMRASRKEYVYLSQSEYSHSDPRKKG